MSDRVIAIDFDGTWTLAPAMWSHFATTMKSYGFEPIIVTGRSARQGIRDAEWLRNQVPRWMNVVYCDHELKEQACKKQGIEPVIWIDDMPGMIQECLLLDTKTSDSEL